MDQSAENTNTSTATDTSGRRRGPSARAPNGSPARPRPVALSLQDTAQRRLSDMPVAPADAVSGDGGQTASVPARRVIGSVTVASPARADVEEFDRQRQLRREGPGRVVNGSKQQQQQQQQQSAPSQPPVSAPTSAMSVQRLSLPSTPSSSQRAIRTHSRGSSWEADNAGSRWSTTRRLVHTESTFTVNSSSAVGGAAAGPDAGDSQRRSRRRSSTNRWPARRASSIADGADELDLDACQLMLAAAAQDSQDRQQHSALQLSDETFGQMQRDLARAVVKADKTRFVAVLDLCKSLKNVILNNTMTATTTTTGDADPDSAAHMAMEQLTTILDSVVDPETGYTIMHLIVLGNQTSLIHAALRYGTTVHSVEDVEGETALMLAMRRAPQSVGLLLTLGKDVDVYRPLRMLVGESRRPLRDKLLDKAVMLRRWTTLAKGHAAGQETSSAATTTTLVLSHRNLLHAAVLADEATPDWPGRAALLGQLIGQHGLDAAQQDIFGFTPALLAREHAVFLGSSKDVHQVQRTLKEAGLVQRFTVATGPSVGATAASNARRESVKHGRGGVEGTAADRARPVMSRLASFALSVRSATLLGSAAVDNDGVDDYDADEPPFRHPHASRQDRHRASDVDRREHSLVQLAASIADLDDPLGSARGSFVRPLLREDTPLTDDGSFLDMVPDSELQPTPIATALPHFNAAAAAPMAAVGAQARARTPVPTARVQYEVVSSGVPPTDATTAAAGMQTPPRAERGASPGVGGGSSAKKNSPSAFVKLRLVSQPATAATPPPAAAATTPTPTTTTAASCPRPVTNVPAAQSAARLDQYLFPTSVVLHPQDAAANEDSVASPLPRKPRTNAQREASPAPQQPVTAAATGSTPAQQKQRAKEPRVFLSRSPAQDTPSAATHRPLTLSPSPVGLHVRSVRTATTSPAPAYETGLTSRHTPSPGIPLAMESGHTTSAGGDGDVAVMDSRIRARAEAVSTALSSMLQVRAVDRRRWRWLGPYTRLGCLVLVLVLQCVSYALDVACAYFREVRFGLWCRALNLIFGDVWTGSAFFMGLTHVACLVLGAVVGVLVLVYVLGLLCGCVLLKLPCFGAADASEAPYLERTFGLFVASFYESRKRPRLFLVPLGLLLGLYSGALVYNALVEGQWKGQAWWARVPPTMSSPSTYRMHLLVLWATNLAINWLALCFVGDLTFQQGLLGVTLPHFLFDRWANGLALRLYLWSRRWGLLWPVQAGRLRSMQVVRAASSEAASARKEYRDEARTTFNRDDEEDEDTAQDADDSPCEMLETSHRLAVHAEAYRLWLFWSVLLLGWAIIAVVFVLVGVLGASASGSSTKAWYAQLGDARRLPPTVTPPSWGLEEETRALLLATAPFSAVRACLAILFASCALGVLCLAALQEWSWPVLLPHWYLSVPGLTVTGVHVGWLLWLWLFVLATFSGRQMVENMRTLVTHRHHNNSDAIAGIVCGAVAMLPALAGVLFLLVCVGRTSLWRLEENRGDDDDDGGDATAANTFYSSGSNSSKSGGSAKEKVIPGSVQSATSNSTLDKTTASGDDGAEAVAAARARDAQRVWPCRPDTVLLREPVPPLFGVLHYLRPELPQWRALLKPTRRRKGKRGGGGGGDGQQAHDESDTIQRGCEAADAALQLFDVAVEMLAHGVRRSEDVEAHDRRLLALLIRCSTEDDADVDVTHATGTRGHGRVGDDAAEQEEWEAVQGHDSVLPLGAALQQRREHYAHKRRECLIEVMAYAGGATASATVAARLADGQRRSSGVHGPGVKVRRDVRSQSPQQQRQQQSARPPPQDRPRSQSLAEREGSGVERNRLKRRMREAEYLRDMEWARQHGPSPAPSTQQ